MMHCTHHVTGISDFKKETILLVKNSQSIRFPERNKGECE